MMLTREEARTLRVLLQLFKIARRSKPWLCTALLTGPELRSLSAAIEPVLGWTEEDEAAVARFVDAFEKETEGRSFTEKSERLVKLLGESGSISSALEALDGKIKKPKKG